MTHQLNNLIPYEFLDTFGECQESKKYASEKITLRVSPYELEMLLQGVSTVFSDYDGPYDVSDYYRLKRKLEKIKTQHVRPNDSARDEAMKGVEVELIPHQDAVAIKTARFTALDDGRCVEVDGPVLRATLMAFNRLTKEDIKRGMRIHVRFLEATQDGSSGCCRRHDQDAL